MIILKTPAEIEVMAQASRVVAEALDIVRKAVQPGITTEELDSIAEQEIRERGACHCVLFGRGDLDNGQFKEAEARLMEEYRGQPLNLKDGVLDTRGMPRDALRDLPVPDTLHQVKRALGRFKGTPFQVIVATEREVTNMKGFAALRGIAFRSERDGDAFRMTLN